MDSEFILGNRDRLGWFRNVCGVDLIHYSVECIDHA